MSSAFPQELRLIIDIISGQYLFCRKKNNYMTIFSSDEERIAKLRKLSDFSQTEWNIKHIELNWREIEKKNVENTHRTIKNKKREVLTVRFSSLSQLLLSEGSLQIWKHTHPRQISVIIHLTSFVYRKKCGHLREQNDRIDHVFKRGLKG